MKTMDLKEICLPLRQEIEDLEAILLKNLTSRVPFVENVVNYVIQNGGKRLRPILTMLSARMAGYQGKESVLIGAAIEFMHTASLLHDDVIDNAHLRRGRATINRKWGNPVCVLVGDFFYCRAMDILVKHGDMKVLRVITDSITVTTEGEILEITKSNDPNTTQEDYLKIITSKTAALIGGACQAGAILGRVSEDFEKALQSFGLDLGIAFQLMDDVLDYTAPEEEFGKTNGTDLREGKLTLPLILAMQKASDAEVHLIKSTLISDMIDQEAFKKIFEIILRYDGVRETIKQAQAYVQKAKDTLAPFRSSIEKDALMAIADYVVYRKN